jgi:hypothetical protein
MYSRSAKGGEKGDPNRNPWLAKMVLYRLLYLAYVTSDKEKSRLLFLLKQAL